MVIEPHQIYDLKNAEIKCEGPTNLIYEFNGVFMVDQNE